MKKIQDGTKEKVAQMFSCCLINNEVMIELLIVNNIFYVNAQFA